MLSLIYTLEHMNPACFPVIQPSLDLSDMAVFRCGCKDEKSKRFNFLIVLCTYVIIG